MRTIAEKRHFDWTKAKRKRDIVRHVYGWPDWYDNLHEYSKNKIHCSCPMCSVKTNNKGRQAWCGSGKRNWTIADKKRIDSLEYEEE